MGLLSGNLWMFKQCKESDTQGSVVSRDVEHFDLFVYREKTKIH